MSKEKLTEYYRVGLLDWMGSGFEGLRFDTLEQAIEGGRSVLTSSAYAYLYSSVLISKVKQLSDREREEEEVLILEKQPETWKIVEIEPKDFDEKSLYRYGDVDAYKKEIERMQKKS